MRVRNDERSETDLKTKPSKAQRKADSEVIKQQGVVLGTYLPPYTAALVRARAAAEGRTVAAEIRLALDAHLSETRGDE